MSSIVPRQADIVSLRPLRADDLQIPLLFCDSLVLHDYGSPAKAILEMDIAQHQHYDEELNILSAELWNSLEQANPYLFYYHSSYYNIIAVALIKYVLSGNIGKE